MIKRNLDGNYFNIERDGSISKICFSDLTDLEKQDVIKDFSAEQLKNLCYNLSKSIEFLGDKYNLSFEELIEK